MILIRTKTKPNASQQLTLGFSILILILILFGLYTLFYIHNVSSLTRIIYNHPLVVSNVALQANVSITKTHRNMKDVVLFTSPAKIDRFIKSVDEQEKQTYMYFDIIKNKILGDEGKALENEARKLLDDWRPIREEVIELIHKGERESAAIITIGKGAVNFTWFQWMMFH